MARAVQPARATFQFTSRYCRRTCRDSGPGRRLGPSPGRTPRQPHPCPCRAPGPPPAGRARLTDLTAWAAAEHLAGVECPAGIPGTTGLHHRRPADLRQPDANPARLGHRHFGRLGQQHPRGARHHLLLARPPEEPELAQDERRRAGPGLSFALIHPRPAGSSRRPAIRSVAGQDWCEPQRTGFGRIGKRVGGNPSRVRISYPPQVRGPAPFIGAGPLRFRLCFRLGWPGGDRFSPALWSLPPVLDLLLERSPFGENHCTMGRQVALLIVPLDLCLSHRLP